MELSGRPQRAWSPARPREEREVSEAPKRLKMWAAGGYSCVRGAGITLATRIRKAMWLSPIWKREGRSQTNATQWGQTHAQLGCLIQSLWPSEAPSPQSLEISSPSPPPRLPRSKARRVGVGWVAQTHSNSSVSMTHRAPGRFQLAHLTDGETDGITGSNASFPFTVSCICTLAGPCGACNIPPLPGLWV